MVTLEKATDILNKYTDESLMQHKKTETVPLWEAGGRVLGQNIVSQEEVPAFHRSQMDGYAILSSDIASAAEDNPITLRIIDTIAAGSYSEKKLLSGTAMKIFTGAPLPQGADCIIKREETQKAEHESGPAVIIKKPLYGGENISLKGEDIKTGEALYSCGSVISFAHIEILAALGVDPVTVFAKPRIGIFSTGNELVELRQPLTHGKLRASNLYTLAELIRLAGGVPVNLGIVRDRLEDVLQVYEQAERLKLPIVISTGGTASGDLDYTKTALEQTKSTRLFNKVAFRPGAPFVTSVKRNQLLIGLSGNPGGAMVAFLFLLFPLISRLEGTKRRLNPSRGRLTAPISRHANLRGFFWGRYEEDGECPKVTYLENQYCGAMQAHMTLNCFIDMPAGKVDLSAGDEVVIWKLPFVQ